MPWVRPVKRSNVLDDVKVEEIEDGECWGLVEREVDESDCECDEGSRG